MKQFVIVLLAISGFNSCCSQAYQDTLFTNYFKRNGTGWNAGDGTISIALADGRTLWMFGDSHVDQGVEGSNELACLFNTRNCVMLQDQAHNFDTYYSPSGTDWYTRQFLQVDGETEITYWPAGGFVHNNRVYSFWERYKISTLFDISFEGMVIAEIGLPDIEIIAVTPLMDSRLAFGMAIVSDIDDGYHYIYGKKTELPFRQAFVARCPIGQIYSNWEFYTADNNWTSDFAQATPILEDVSNAYSVFSCNDSYFLLSQERGFLQCGEGRNIYLYESENPQGPFENRKIIYTVEDQFDGEYLRTYNAQAHPQFTKNGELLVSYNINKTCPHPCDDANFNTFFNADLYRPKFIRVPLDCLPLANEHVNNNLQFRIYPNPVQQLLYIDSPDHAKQSTSFEIYNLLGRIIRKGHIQHSLDLSNLENGVYILRLVSDKYEQIERISKL